MNPETMQNNFAMNAGYNEWAETNKIIVLYPQSAKLNPDNPYACWDWFGFTGNDFATKTGRQMVSLKKMIERMAKISM
jgi:poly(3-hydroxybutyrate) depolymerase